MTDRIEQNVTTGEKTTIQLTPQEEAARQAESDARAPIRAQIEADAAATAAAKADATIQYLVSHTPAECYSRVQAATNFDQLKDVVGRLAIAVSVLARRTLR